LIHSLVFEPWLRILHIPPPAAGSSNQLARGIPLSISLRRSHCRNSDGAFLQKPFRLEALIEAVGGALCSHRAR